MEHMNHIGGGFDVAVADDGYVWMGLGDIFDHAFDAIEITCAFEFLLGRSSMNRNSCSSSITKPNSELASDAIEFGLVIPP